MRDLIIIYIAVINVTAFFLSWYDKRAAIKGSWRVPERNLFLAALLGGGCGMLASMLLFRHKTRHLKFMIGIPLILILNLYIFVKGFQLCS